MTREDKVGLFNKAAGNKTFKGGGSQDSHLSCFKEEVDELLDAAIMYCYNTSEENRKALAKEWADAQVTLSNIAWFFDLDGSAAFNRVHNNNMTKLVDGKIVRREDGKILKPEGYQPPDMSGL